MGRKEKWSNGLSLDSPAHEYQEDEAEAEEILRRSGQKDGK